MKKPLSKRHSVGSTEKVVGVLRILPTRETSTSGRTAISTSICVLSIAVAQHAVGRVRPGGTLLFMGGTGGRRRGPGLSLIAAGTAALPALIANLALEVAPIRVNLIAAGFVDTPLSASLLGDDLDQRRDQLRATLPIGPYRIQR